MATSLYSTNGSSSATICGILFKGELTLKPIISTRCLSPLSEHLKTLRLGASLTTKHLGEALQLAELYKSPPARIILDYESGRRTPIKAVLERYTRYFRQHPKCLEALLPKAPQARKLKACQTELGRTLRKARLDAGLTLKKMVFKLGLSDFYPSLAKNPDTGHTLMWFWEIGRHRPKIEVLQRYTEILGISLPDEPLHPAPHDDRDRTDVEVPYPRESLTLYYQCTRRDRYGIPTEIERHAYNEEGALETVEKRKAFV